MSRVHPSEALPNKLPVNKLWIFCNTTQIFLKFFFGVGRWRCDGMGWRGEGYESVFGGGNTGQDTPD